MKQREIKQTSNALFCNQLELYITLGNRIQNKYREISWSERKGETWNGGYNINNVLQDNFMIHYYWWNLEILCLLKIRYVHYNDFVKHVKSYKNHAIYCLFSCFF